MDAADLDICPYSSMSTACFSLLAFLFASRRAWAKPGSWRLRCPALSRPINGAIALRKNRQNSQTKAAKQQDGEDEGTKAGRQQQTATYLSMLPNNRGWMLSWAASIDLMRLRSFGASKQAGQFSAITGNSLSAHEARKRYGCGNVSVLRQGQQLQLQK